MTWIKQPVFFRTRLNGQKVGWNLSQSLYLLALPQIKDYEYKKAFITIAQFLRKKVI